MDDLIGSFKSIASDAVRCSTLLKDSTSLNGLVLLLANAQTPETTTDILEIFRSLSGVDSGIPRLAGLTGLRDVLVSIIKLDENSAPDVRELAKKVYDRIYFKKPSLGRNDTVRTKKRSKPRQVVVQLSGNVTMPTIKAIESKLPRLRGIVSITFQLDKCRVIVMAVESLKSEDILSCINDACNEVAKESNQTSTSASVIRRQKSTMSRQGLRRNGTFRSHRSFRVPPNASVNSALAATPVTNESRAGVPLKPYLEENADVFEVDEKKGVPMPMNSDLGRGGTSSRGITGWLSDLLESTFFW